MAYWSRRVAVVKAAFGWDGMIFPSTELREHVVKRVKEGDDRCISGKVSAGIFDETLVIAFCEGYAYHIDALNKAAYANGFRYEDRTWAGGEEWGIYFKPLAGDDGMVRAEIEVDGDTHIVSIGISGYSSTLKNKLLDEVRTAAEEELIQIIGGRKI